MSAVAAISKFSGFEISAFSRAMSESRMWRRSSRKCAVMPSAPASIAANAARTGSGRAPPRALRSVAACKGLPIDALDPGDDGLGAQLGDNSAEMLEVIDLKIDGELGEVRRSPRHTDIVDITVVL